MKILSNLKLSSIAKINFFRLYTMYKLKIVSSEVYSNFLDFTYEILNFEELGDISRFDVFMIELRKNNEDSLDLIIFTEIDETYVLNLELSHYSIGYLIPAINYIFGNVFICNYIN